MASYEKFLDELDNIWAECLRILVSGGRVACVVGDVCISRRKGGRHHVLPLSADLQVRARKLGFDNLTPIRWQKVSNINLEASRSSHFPGQAEPTEWRSEERPRAHTAFRKPGGYRKPTAEMERRSFIPTDEYAKWFSPVWTDVTGQLRRDHPAPYPIEIPRRLIRMCSFAGDTVVDPWAAGTTALAAAETGRNSITVEVEPQYVGLIEQRLAKPGALVADVHIHRTP